MKLSPRRLLPGFALAFGVVALAALADRPAVVAAADQKAPDSAAVERTRETVKMVDDLYKGYVVHITKTYVDAKGKRPAARVTHSVFRHMEEKGWHKARLVDGSGDPVGADTLPKTDFEKRAIERIKKGAPYYDEVDQAGGKPVLRAATVVPVVMKECSICHSTRKEGELLGAIVYEFPIK